MRHYIQISARHKLLVVNRAYLAQGGPADARAEAHGACVQNAKAILQELERGQQRGEVPMQSLWTIPYHSVAAVVVLALDMIKLGRNNVNPRLLRDRSLRYTGPIWRYSALPQQVASPGEACRYVGNHWRVFVDLTRPGTFRIGHRDQCSFAGPGSERQQTRGNDAYHYEVVCVLSDRHQGLADTFVGLRMTCRPRHPDRIPNGHLMAYTITRS